MSRGEKERGEEGYPRERQRDVKERKREVRESHKESLAFYNLG